MPEDPDIYMTCPSCTVVIRLKASHADGSVICPDCLKRGHKAVLEDAHIPEPGESADSD